jgi:hypothetical protein
VTVYSLVIWDLTTARRAAVVVQYNPTEEQKRSILGPALYEIEQLLHASRLSTNNLFVSNAVLESVLLHVRTLLDFYERSTRSTRQERGQTVEQDDVLALDFGFAAQEIAIPDDYRERLNKDLAHLTYSRLERRTLDSKQWDHRRVTCPVLSRSREFVTYVSSDYLDEGNAALIARCESLLEDIDRRIRELE